MTDPSGADGHFVWRELLTGDLEGALRFYQALFEWQYERRDTDGHPYVMVSAGGRQIGGITTIPAGMQFPAHWHGYVLVPDVDGAARRAVERGARILVGPEDIPGVGRFAGVMDPLGAVFTLFQTTSPGPGDGGRGPMRFCWEQLGSPDPGASAAFYRDVVGWEASGDAAMRLFGAGEQEIASLMPTPEGVRRASWLTFVEVPSIETFRDRAASLGAEIVVPEIPVPNVGRFTVFADPTGAVLALFEPTPH